MEFYDLVDTWATADDETLTHTLDVMAEQARLSDLNFFTISANMWWRLRMFLEELAGGPMNLDTEKHKRPVNIEWQGLRVICDEDTGA